MGWRKRQRCFLESICASVTKLQQIRQNHLCCEVRNTKSHGSPQWPGVASLSRGQGRSRVSSRSPRAQGERDNCARRRMCTSECKWASQANLLQTRPNGWPLRVTSHSATSGCEDEPAIAGRAGERGGGGHGPTGLSLMHGYVIACPCPPSTSPGTGRGREAPWVAIQL